MFVIDEDLKVVIPEEKIFEVAVGFEKVKRGELRKFGRELYEGWRIDIARYIHVNGKEVPLNTVLSLRIANYITGDKEVKRLTYPEVELLIRKMLCALEDINFSARAGALVLLKNEDEFIVSYGSKLTVLGEEERFLVATAIKKGWYFKNFGFWVNEQGVSFAGYMVEDTVPLYMFLEVGTWKIR